MSWTPRGGSLYVTEMSGDRQCITRLDPRGRRHVVVTTGGRPNGLAVDGDGNLWIAEAGLRAVLCVAPDGREILRIDGPPGEQFRFPNDLAFGPDGHLYMTDSGLALTDFLDGQDFVEDYQALAWDGRVYEIDPKAAAVVRRIDSGIRFTNGIAFDAAGMLYANASFLATSTATTSSRPARRSGNCSATSCSRTTRTASRDRTA